MTENPKVDSSEHNKFIRQAARKKKPVFDSFQKLCKIRPSENIDYVDFEWKYYQYYHGNQDLTIKRSPDNSSPLTLSDLPSFVLEKVVGKLDLIDRLALRKLSRDLRNVADSTEIYCKEVDFVFDDDHSRIWLHNFELLYEPMGQERCGVSFGRSDPDKTKRYEDNRNFKHVMIADASTFLKNPKLRIDRLLFAVNRVKSMAEFLEFLKSLNFQLDVRSIQIKSNDEIAARIFPFLNAESLERIQLGEILFYGYLRVDEFEQIAETEQWNSAESLVCYPFFERIDMMEMLHFKRIILFRFEFTSQNLIKLRNLLFHSTHLESCYLRIEDLDWFNNDVMEEEFEYDGCIKSELDRIMGKHPLYDPKTLRFPIPRRLGYFQLEIERDHCEEGLVTALKIERVSGN